MASVTTQVIGGVVEIKTITNKGTVTAQIVLDMEPDTAAIAERVLYGLRAAERLEQRENDPNHPWKGSV